MKVSNLIILQSCWFLPDDRLMSGRNYTMLTWKPKGSEEDMIARTARHLVLAVVWLQLQGCSVEQQQKQWSNAKASVTSVEQWPQLNQPCWCDGSQLRKHGLSLALSMMACWFQIWWVWMRIPALRRLGRRLLVDGAAEVCWVINGKPWDHGM